MGLFKFAMIAAVGIALLPADREEQAALYQKAAATTHWVVTFCDRNQFTCEQSSTLWTQFLKKAEFGAGLVYDMWQGRESTAPAREAPAVGDQRAIPPAPAFGQASLRSKSTAQDVAGTLRPDDLSPQWRGRFASASVAAGR